MMKTLAFALMIAILCGTGLAAQRRVFVIGDSISIAYGPALKTFLGSGLHYDRKRDRGEAREDLDKAVGANGGDSRMVLAYLKELQADRTFAADVLLLNCGLHDIKTDKATGKRQVEPDEYVANLKAICRLSKQMRLKLVWVTSTPVDDAVHNARNVGFFRYDRDVDTYNQLARRVFEKEHVPIIDLYAFSRAFPSDAYADHVHYRPEYVALQAAFIAGSLLSLTSNGRF
jgi:lysophospholipase L1-like esterase